MGRIDNRGISCLGLCHPKYDANALVRLYKESNVDVIRFGWLDKFFAPDSTKPGLLMRMQRLKFCRVHIINGPGLNNNRVQKHEISYGYNNKTLEAAILKRDNKFLDKFRKRLIVIKNIAEQAQPNTLILAISPWLEHAPIQKKTFEILAKEVLQIIPSALIVDNPVRGGFISLDGIKVLKEKHGSNPPRECDIVDLDGEDMETVNMRNFGEAFPKALAVYGWGLRENGNHKDKGWLPPEKRVDFPRDRERRLMKYWIEPTALEETSPLDAKDLAGLITHNPQDGAKRGFVFKLGDDRNYAVCLLPTDLFKDKPESVIIKKNGKRIDIGKVRGRYTEDGSNRWIIDFTKPVTSFPTNIVIVVNKKHGYVIKIPGLNRVD